MDVSWLDFALACMLMGMGIGTDVALATLARANQLQDIKTISYWVVGVSLTHTLFPMLGYLLTYFSVQILPILTPIVGIVAATCIFWFLYHEISAIKEAEDRSESQRLLVSLGLILAVSWDALWSGPAKSAQVIGWPEMMVWGSFVLVGMAVSLLAISSVSFAKILAPLMLKTKKVHLTLLWLQYSVIAYFGYLAIFRYTFDLSISWYSILGVSLTTVAILIVTLGNEKSIDLCSSQYVKRFATLTFLVLRKVSK